MDILLRHKDIHTRSKVSVVVLGKLGRRLVQPCVQGSGQLSLMLVELFEESLVLHCLQDSLAFDGLGVLLDPDSHFKVFVRQLIGFDYRRPAKLRLSLLLVGEQAFLKGFVLGFLQ